MKSKINFYFLWLSLICIVVFILQQISGFTEIFILNSNAFEDFEIWRFLTAIFLHASIVHLVYNLFALLFFGFVLEKLIGSKKFLIVFFGGGIIANIISVNFYDSSLGASGAIYSILGCIAVLKPMMMVWAFGLMMPMFVAGILWIIGDILGVFGFGSESIGNIAHLSGIGVGLVIGLIARYFVKGSVEKNNKVDVPEVYVEGWEDKWM